MNNNSGVDFDNLQTPQIAMIQTDKKLIEFNDKLHATTILRYARIHADGDDDGTGKKVYSKIGITMQDYSDRNTKTKKVTANIDPEDVRFILSRMDACVPEFDYKAEKIFGFAEDGRSYVTKLRIARQDMRKDRNTGAMVKSSYPWYIEIANGTANGIRGKNGGMSIDGPSYQETGKVYMNLSDLDAHTLFSKAVAFINVFELQTGWTLLAEVINERLSSQGNE